MTTTSDRPKLAPVTCEPWCAEGTGHTDAHHPDDQRCFTIARMVPLSRYEPYLEKYQTVPIDPHLEHSACAGEDGMRWELDWHGIDDPGCLKLTMAEARAFAESILACCGEVDGTAERVSRAVDLLRNGETEAAAAVMREGVQR